MTLALKLLRRRLKGPLRSLWLGLVLMVTSVVAVLVFADRLERALTYSSSALLAADMVISSRSPVENALVEEGMARQLQHSEMLVFSSMAFAVEQGSPASVKAVDDHYPLRGTVQTSLQAFERGNDATAGPERGEIWLDSLLVARLGVALGDAVDIGDASLRFSRVLIREPDPTQGAGFAPRILMHLDDVPMTRILRPGSRVNYRYLFAGEQQPVADYMTWLNERLQPYERIRSVGDTQPGLSQVLQRGQSFLLLCALLVLITCGGAVAISARRYAEQQIMPISLFKAFGLTPGQVLKLLCVQLGLLGISAWIFGVLLGQGVQWLLALAAQQILQYSLPEGGYWPYLASLLAVSALLGYALPPILKLWKLSPMTILRRGELPSGALGWVLPLLCTAIMLVLVLLYTGGWLFIGIATGCLLGLFVFSGLGLRIVVRLIRRAGAAAGGYWRLLSANLASSREQQPLQLTIIALALLTGLLLAVIRLELLGEWQQGIPVNAPNHFLINIADGEVDELSADLQQQDWENSGFYPVMGARLLEVDGVSLPGRDESQAGARDVNMGWAQNLPEGNEIVAGAWWDQSSLPAPRVSLEQGFADRYGLDIGSRVQLSIAERTIEASVASIRRLDWDNMRPNFWILAEPEMVTGIGGLYVTSFRTEPGQGQLLVEFMRRWPSLTLISIDTIIEQTRTLIDQASLAVGLVYIMVLSSVLLVLYTVLSNARQQRFSQLRIVWMLGQSAQTLWKMQMLEFMVRGAVAGAMAALFAEAAVWALEYFWLQVSPRFHLWVWLTGPIVGALLVPGIAILTGAGGRWQGIRATQ